VDERAWWSGAPPVDLCPGDLDGSRSSSLGPIDTPAWNRSCPAGVAGFGLYGCPQNEWRRCTGGI